MSENNDRFGFWVRFICSLLFTSTVIFFISLRFSYGHFSISSISIIVGLALLCSLYMAKAKDEGWGKVLAYLRWF